MSPSKETWLPKHRPHYQRTCELVHQVMQPYTIYTISKEKARPKLGQALHYIS
ncbi:hypothetical protein GCWU000182_01423 [Abiotrophia defectiva ATCC 49176]|uniref:Uncharacterized protein n=1 Tax=Abiotrophia defectiva ATCC 49176 TaxID=592010 RepID=W1Q2F4_ABIDE|nr:hypothetical protein GCWU000182_01423 [Abiotrophia defectiva ATCC 49176]